MSLSWDLQPPTGMDPAVGEPGNEGILEPCVGHLPIGLLSPKSDFSAKIGLLSAKISSILGVADPEEVGADGVDLGGQDGDLVAVLGLDVVVVEGLEDSVGEPDDEDVVVTSISQIRLNFISLPFLQKYRERETSS